MASRFTRCLRSHRCIIILLLLILPVGFLTKVYEGPVKAGYRTRWEGFYTWSSGPWLSGWLFTPRSDTARNHGKWPSLYWWPPACWKQCSCGTLHSSRPSGVLSWDTRCWETPSHGLTCSTTWPVSCSLYYSSGHAKEKAGHDRQSG
jgi:hypothetical protein